MSERLLLDTQVVVWALTDPDSLSGEARDVVADASNELVVCPASAYEIAAKFRTGRWPEAEPLATRFGDLITAMGARELTITVAHALRAGALQWEHRDPFDRLLVAQCIVEGLTLVTADRAIRSFAGVRTLW